MNIRNVACWELAKSGLINYFYLFIYFIWFSYIYIIITEINELFHGILIYWDAYVYIYTFFFLEYCTVHYKLLKKHTIRKHQWPKYTVNSLLTKLIPAHNFFPYSKSFQLYANFKVKFPPDQILTNDFVGV